MQQQSDNLYHKTHEQRNRPTIPNDRQNVIHTRTENPTNTNRHVLVNSMLDLSMFDSKKCSDPNALETNSNKTKTKTNTKNENKVTNSKTRPT